MTPTRCPVKSTGSCGQRPVWKVGPPKLSRPGKSGILAADRQPVAITRNRAAICWPPSAVITHWLAASSNLAARTRVPSWMSRRRSNRSATWLR